MKLEVYNLIILDESGSMGGMKMHTIDGCNETINTTIATQKEYADTQDHFISIYAFQSNPSVPSRYLIYNRPVSEAKHITQEQYDPWGSTPLYDALGETLTSLKAVTDGRENAIGSVTIITDGYENASRHYRHGDVAEMIKALKAKGWNFNFIGANIDVERVSHSLNIDNSLAFDQSEEGTRIMFDKVRCSRKKYFDRVNDLMQRCEIVSREDLADAEKGFFED